MVTGMGKKNAPAFTDEPASANNELADFEARLLEQHQAKMSAGKPKYKVPFNAQKPRQ